MTASVVLFLYSLTSVLSETIESKNDQKNTKVPNNTKYIKSTPLCQDNFDHVPPRAQPISFCKQFSQETCCNKTHTDAISRSAYPFWEEEFNDDCRQWTVSVLCSPCDPLVGIGYNIGICQHFCSRWYAACKKESYTVGEGEMLVPCRSSSIVCWPLKDIISNGDEFCERSGFPVARRETDPTIQNTPFANFLSGGSKSSRNHRCYDGHVFAPILSSPRSRTHKSRRKPRKKSKKSKRWTWSGSMTVLWILLCILWSLYSFILKVIEYCKAKKKSCKDS